MALTGVQLGDLIIRLIGDTSQFEKQMERAERQIRKAQKKLGDAGRKMTLAVTAPLAALGGAAVKAFASFDDAMVKSTSIMGNVSAEMRAEMEKTALSISKNSVTSAEDLAQSYFFLASAGMNAQQSIAALPAVEKFAVAGAFDMATATDLLTDAQSALGLSSKDAQKNLAGLVSLSDVLVKANTLANASVEQFSKALTTKAAASLRNLNKPMEEGVAVLAAFADQGIKGELAGEKLSIVLRDMQASAQKNEKVWKRLGLSVFDSAGKMHNIANIIAQLERRFGGMSDKQKKATATQLGFQDRSFGAIQSLIGLSDTIREYEEALRSASGVTEEVAGRQLKSFSAQMKILWNNVKAAGILIGKTLAPHVRKVGDVIRGGLVYWESLSQNARNFVIAAAAILAVIGPVLLGLSVLGKVLTAIVVTFQLLIAGTWAWYAMIVVIPAALVLVSDALGVTNSGLTELVNNFRIGGIKISTWFQGTYLNLVDGWDWVVTNFQKGLLVIINQARETGEAIATGIITGLKKATEAWIRAKKFMSGTNVVGRGIGGASAFGNLEEVEKSNRRFDQLLSKVKDTSKKAGNDLYKTFANLEESFQKKRLQREKTLRWALHKDEMELIVAEEKARKALAFPEIPKFPNIPNFPDIKMEKAIEQTQFQQVNLKRFALKGPGGLAGSPTKEQKVEAPGVEKKLDEVVEAINNGRGRDIGNIAVLG